MFLPRREGMDPCVRNMPIAIFHASTQTQANIDQVFTSSILPSPATPTREQKISDHVRVNYI
jgi:hypothetical protein